MDRSVAPGKEALRAESLVHACGKPVTVEVERGNDPARIDHVWIDIDGGLAGTLRGAVNTWSRRNALAGFDPRVRVGLLRQRCEELPDVGLFPSPGLNYAGLEARANVFYETYEKGALELLLIKKTEAATAIEMWGQLFVRLSYGIHQIHSRRASCAVAEDLIGHDGALKFYSEDEEGKVSEMMLLKFCGQP